MAQHRSSKSCNQIWCFFFFFLWLDKDPIKIETLSVEMLLCGESLREVSLAAPTEFQLVNLTSEVSEELAVSCLGCILIFNYSNNCGLRRGSAVTLNMCVHKSRRLRVSFGLIQEFMLCSICHTNDQTASSDCLESGGVRGSITSSRSIFFTFFHEIISSVHYLFLTH